MKTAVAVATTTFLSFVTAQVIANEPLAVSIIEAPEPIEYRMDNHLHPVANIFLFGGPTLANKVRNNGMSARLTSAIYRDNYKPTALLISTIESNLQEAGVHLTEKTKVSINPTKPDQVNYKSINLHGNALLHVYVGKIGLQSRKDTYQPFIQVSFCLVLPSNQSECAVGDWSYYGDGYMEEDYLVYPADIADQWADEDDAMRRIQSVETALSKGLLKIARGISDDIVKNLPSSNPGR